VLCAYDRATLRQLDLHTLDAGPFSDDLEAKTLVHPSRPVVDGLNGDAYALVG
jgi:hypothetical protein